MFSYTAFEQNIGAEQLSACFATQTYGNLGEGASGDVFLSAFKGNQVAVKVFKSEVGCEAVANVYFPCLACGNTSEIFY